MRVLPSPLFLLIRLQTWAGLRRKLRALRRPKGIIAFVLSVALLLLWLVPAVVVPRDAGARASDAVVAPQPSGGPASDLGPFIILGLLLLSIVGTPSDRALVFSQAEVDFLFTAPFSRRQLLLYNLAKRLLPLVILSIFFALVGRRFTNSIPAAFLGSLLLFGFLNLATLCAALFGQLLGEHRFRLARRLLIVGVIAAVGAGSWWLSQDRGLDPLTAFRAFTASPVGQIVAMPAVPFARVLAASDLAAALVPWGVVALAMNIVLLLLAIRLDANWLEASSESSRKLHERIQRLRQGGSAAASPARFAFVRVPMPPRLGGLGPLAWRQVVGALRGGGRSLWIFLVMIVAAGVPLFFSGAIRDNLSAIFRPMSLVLLGYMSLFAPQILRIDFRGDIDRLDLLKALPVSATQMAIAQIGVAALTITIVQWIVAIPMGYMLDWRVDALPLWALVALGVNLVNVGLDNAAFLMWPHRPQHAPGMNLASGQMLVQMLKLMVLFVCLGLAAAAAVLTALALPGPTGIWLAATAALLVLTVEAAAAILATAALFARLDPAVERVGE